VERFQVPEIGPHIFRLFVLSEYLGERLTDRLKKFFEFEE
jgi:hypothetical protein